MTHKPLEFGWRTWALGALDAYRGARLSMSRKEAARWVWWARPL